MSEFNRRVRFVQQRTGLVRDGDNVIVEGIADSLPAYRSQRDANGVAVFARFHHDSLAAPSNTPSPEGVSSYRAAVATLALPQDQVFNRVYLHVPAEDTTGTAIDATGRLGTTGTLPIVAFYFPILRSWVYADTRGDKAWADSSLLYAERVVALAITSEDEAALSPNVNWSEGIGARMRFIEDTARDDEIAAATGPPPGFDAWCAVTDQGVGTDLVSVDASLPVAERRVSLRVRFDARIVPGMQLQFDGWTYTVASIEEQPERRRTLVLDCSTAALANL